MGTLSGLCGSGDRWFEEGVGRVAGGFLARAKVDDWSEAAAIPSGWVRLGGGDPGLKPFALCPVPFRDVDQVGRCGGGAGVGEQRDEHPGNR